MEILGKVTAAAGNWRTEFYKLLAGIGGIVAGFVLVFIRRAFLKDKEWPCVKKIISP